MRKTQTVYLHFAAKATGNTDPLYAVSFSTVALSTDTSKEWSGWCQQHYGTLLEVREHTWQIPEGFNPITCAVEDVKAEIKNLQAETEMKLKELRSKLNDLLMIGWNAGSIEEVQDPNVVTEVVAREASNTVGTHPLPEGDDDGIPF